MPRGIKIVLLVIGLCFLLWTMLALIYSESRFLFPAPWEVFKRVAMSPMSFFYSMWVTAQEMLFSMALALVLAGLLGWGMRQNPTLCSVIQSFFLLFQCLPTFTLAPLFILWFGWSKITIVVPTALMIVFPMALTFYRGLSQVPKEIVQYYTVHGASRWQLFSSIKIPFALPHIFSGLRVAASLSAIGAVAAEWAGAQEGLGVLIQEYRRAFDMTALFAALLCLIALSFVLYGMIYLAEKMCCKGVLYENQ